MVVFQGQNILSRCLRTQNKRERIKDILNSTDFYIQRIGFNKHESEIKLKLSSSQAGTQTHLELLSFFKYNERVLTKMNLNRNLSSHILNEFQKLFSM